MPDFSAPVAQNIIPPNPNQGLTTLSNIMQLGRQKQALQIGGAQVQNEVQQMNERKLLQNMMLTGKDPDGNPIKDANGEIDAPAFAAAANKYMPLTGQQVQQNIINTLNDRVQLNNNVRQLGQNERNDISGIIRSAIGTNQDPAQITEALNAYGVKNPTAAGAISRAQSLLGNLNGNVPQQQRDMALQHLAMEFQPAGTTEAEQTPAIGAITTKTGNLGFTQTNPYAPQGMGEVGPEVGIGVAPAQRTGVTFVPGTNQPVATVLNPSGVGAQVQPVGQTAPAQPGPGNVTQKGWSKLPMIPTPQQTASASMAATEADAIRNADSNPVSGYGSTKQVYQNLLDLVKTNPAIGPHSQSWNQLTGILTPFGATANSTMQEVDSYLDRLALQNAGYAGLSTDAARQMSAVAAGTTEMNPKALAEKLRFGAATLAAAHFYREGLDNVIGTDNSNPIAKRQFDSEWAKNADINAFRLLTAKQMGDQTGYNETLQQIRAMPAAQRALIQQHMKNLNMLVNGELPK